MRIGIVGTGKMATGLAKGWLKAGHTITFGSRDPKSRAIEMQRVVGPQVRVALQKECLADAEVVLITLPYTQVVPFAKQFSEQLKRKVVIDISNPFEALPDNRISGAEQTSKAIGEGARVVAAFKTNYAGILTQPVDAGGVQRDVFYCGDDPAAKDVAKRLIEALGFRAVDCGPLHSAGVLDPMVPLMIELDRKLGGQGSTRRGHWKFMTP